MMQIMGEENDEGDEYENDFEDEPIDLITQRSQQMSPLNAKRIISTYRSGQNSHGGGVSPKTFGSTRSQMGTAGGLRARKQYAGTESNNPEMTARSSCSLVTVNSVLTGHQQQQSSVFNMKPLQISKK